jgi:hypothetical protein
MLSIPGHNGNAHRSHIKISSHHYLNGYHQGHKHQQMLARMQRKRNPYTLLVGMQISTTSLESNVEISQNLQTELP